MFLNQHIIAKVSLIISKLSMQVLLLDANGQVILPESNKRSLQLPEQLKKNPCEPFINGAFTLIGTDEAEPLYLCFSGNNDEVVSCARLCAQLVDIAIKEEHNVNSAENSMRLILNSEVDSSEIEALAKERQIDLEVPRAIIYAHFTDTEGETVASIVKAGFEVDSGDFVCEVGRHAIAIVKTVDEKFDEEDLDAYAEALQSTLMSETGANGIIGIGTVKPSLIKLYESLDEAKKAVQIGRMYHPTQTEFNYKKIVLERFLANVPEETAASFHQHLFNRTTNRLFNEEMLQTIEEFFKNNLNLSETARQLYIHRNTLVYRLDKIQKCVGLDLRSFDDAVTFKLLMLLGKQKNDKRVKN